MGSLDYLATWIAWERDSGKRGQDAAASWKLANIQTWECTNMGYCDDLATTLQALLAATQALECCGEQDITDGSQYTDDVIDGVGDVPQNIIDAGYADDASDWTGFGDYKCMISHLAVDHIETFFREISPFINASGIVVGGIGVVGALLGAILVVVGLPISAGILVALGASAGIWTWISTYGKTAVLDLADEIATNHDALACAIYEGDGIADAIADFNDKVDDLFSTIEATAIKAVGFEPQLKAMYSGRYQQDDIAEKLSDLGYATTGYACVCGEEEDPPTGWHLEYPLLIHFREWNWCINEGSSYNPATGILNIQFTPTGAPQFDMKARFDRLAWHGYVIDVLSYDLPSTVHEIGHMMTSTVFYETHVVPGETYAGIHTARLNPADPDWADWLAQWDYIVNCSGSANEKDFFLDSLAAPLVQPYRVTVRVRTLYAD
jgi:hypothetical protein